MPLQPLLPARGPSATRGYVVFPPLPPLPRCLDVLSLPSPLPSSYTAPPLTARQQHARTHARTDVTAEAALGHAIPDSQARTRTLMDARRNARVAQHAATRYPRGSPHSATRGAHPTARRRVHSSLVVGTRRSAARRLVSWRVATGASSRVCGRQRRDGRPAAAESRRAQKPRPAMRRRGIRMRYKRPDVATRCHRTVLHDVASWPSALQHGRAGSRERVGSCACECAYDVVRYGDAVHPAQPRLVPRRPCATAAVRRQWQRPMPLPAASMHVVALVIHRMPCVGGLGVGYECVARPAFCS